MLYACIHTDASEIWRKMTGIDKESEYRILYAGGNHGEKEIFGNGKALRNG